VAPAFRVVQLLSRPLASEAFLFAQNVGSTFSLAASLLRSDPALNIVQFYAIQTGVIRVGSDPLQ
jgi:hypothetical protein